MANLPYTPSYWDKYYHDSYESTYQYGFNPSSVLDDWRSVFENTWPTSFADIGCGPGQTLKSMAFLLPDAKVYGVEVQQIPPERCVSDKILFGDFVKIHPKLERVDLLYVSCSMYVPWEEQEAFLRGCSDLAIKAMNFANVYLEDKRHIPEDSLRKVIYRTRKGFQEYMEELGWVRLNHDFFVRAELASRFIKHAR